MKKGKEKEKMQNIQKKFRRRMIKMIDNLIFSYQLPFNYVFFKGVF